MSEHGGQRAMGGCRALRVRQRPTREGGTVSHRVNDLCDGASQGKGDAAAAGVAVETESQRFLGTVPLPAPGSTGVGRLKG
jgi:hypothetical protein